MSSTIHYFAYGSNLTPSRLIARIGPCRSLGRAMLAGFSLEFRKHGGDGSSKCDLKRTQNPSDVAEGVIYEIPSEARSVLDRFEGVGRGYSIETVLSRTDEDPAGSLRECFIYLANPPFAGPEIPPFCWYRDFVLEGGRVHGFSNDWLAWVAGHPVTVDEDHARRTFNGTILRSNREEALELHARNVAT